MATFTVSSDSPASSKADLLVLPLFAGGAAGPGVAEASTALGSDLAALAAANGVTGSLGQTLVVPTLGRLPSSAVLLVGLGGEREADAPTVIRAARRAAGQASRYASVATTLHRVGRDAGAAAQAVAEGFALGLYRFSRYKERPIDEGSKEPVAVRRVQVLMGGGRRSSAATERAARDGLRRGRAYADAANWARDLVNTPSIEATPAYLAAQARSMARAAGVTCRVWTKADLEKGGFGGILGVGSGSANAPRLVELTYRGAGSAQPFGIAGKGVTFDSGGLSLKTAEGMETMKDDMSGAAATFAVLRGLAELKVKVNVVAAVPLAENMPSGSAIRPGDVLRHRGGKTSEVMNTDAEGRLILADALALLTERKPRCIIDSATLTGAAVVALGRGLWAAMGTDDRLVADMLAAGTAAAEPGWELPLWLDYRRNIESSIADVKNTGGDRYGGAITAGLFLREFVGDVPWVHMDVAATAFVETPTDGYPRGATGAPTRTILRYLEGQAER